MNTSADSKEKVEHNEHIQKLKLMTERYGEKGLSVYLTFPNDVESGNPLRNREIANIMKAINLYNPAIQQPYWRFLEKVSAFFFKL